MRTFVAFLLMSAVMAGQDRSELADTLRQGMRLVEAGQLATAQEFYEKSLRNHPDDADLSYEVAMVHFRQRNWPKAIENFRISVGKKPGRIKPLYYLAQSYFMESDFDLARETIAQAARIAPNDPQVCQKYGEYLSVEVKTRREGLSWLQKARVLSPGLARIDFEIGKVQFELTDFPSAASSFEAALKKDASDGQAAFFLAETWTNLGDYGKARQRYDDALAQGYAIGTTYYGMGKALVELGQFEAALDPLQHAIAVQPSLIQAHFQLGRAYRHLGRTEDSVHETMLFGALTNRIDTTRELRGVEEENAWRLAKPLLQQGKEQEALELLAKLPDSDRFDRGEPHYLLGAVYFSLGRKEEAVRVLRTARKEAPKSARIAAYLGFVELSSGQTAPAEDSFKSALALDSSEVLALIGMGVARYERQKWAEAADYLERSRTADPGTLYMLCDAYFRINRAEDAKLTAEVIRALGHDNKAVLDAVDKLVKQHASDRQSTLP